MKRARVRPAAAAGGRVEDPVEYAACLVRGCARGRAQRSRSDPAVAPESRRGPANRGLELDRGVRKRQDPREARLGHGQPLSRSRCRRASCVPPSAPAAVSADRSLAAVCVTVPQVGWTRSGACAASSQPPLLECTDIGIATSERRPRSPAIRSLPVPRAWHPVRRWSPQACRRCQARAASDASSPANTSRVGLRIRLDDRLPERAGARVGHATQR